MSAGGAGHQVYRARYFSGTSPNPVVWMDVTIGGIYAGRLVFEVRTPARRSPTPPPPRAFTMQPPPYARYRSFGTTWPPEPPRIFAACATA